MSESTLQRLFLMRAVEAIPDLRLFRRNVGVGQVHGGHRVAFGIKGQADLHGYLRGSPAVPVEIELKAASGRTSPEQETWAAFCRSWGVTYLLLQAKRNEQPEETVGRWISELRSALER